MDPHVKMTARPQDVALLPLPERLEKIASYAEALNFTAIHSSSGVEPVTITPVPGSIREAAAALASAQAREEELRAEVERLRASARSAGEAMGVEAEARADAEWKVVQLAEEVLKSRERAERLEEALRDGLSGLNGLFASGDYPLTDEVAELGLAIIEDMQAALSANAATQTGETT